MKTFNPILSKKLLFLSLLIVSFTGNAQTERALYTVGLANVSQTANTIEMDVTFTIDNPTRGTKLSQLSVGINYNTSILNNGDPCNSKNCGSWVYIGGKSPAIASLLTTINSLVNPYGHLRIIGIPLNETSSIVIQNGTYTLGRYRFTNTKPWIENSNAQLWLQPTNQENATNTILSSYENDNSLKLVAYTTTSTFNDRTLSLQYTKEAPLDVILNSKINDTDNFNAIAFPNPYSENFNLNIKSSSENNIQIKVYSMIGKLIEVHNVKVSEIENQNIGSNYSAGVYNIIVTQGENSKALKIVKQ